MRDATGIAIANAAELLTVKCPAMHDDHSMVESQANLEGIGLQHYHLAI